MYFQFQGKDHIDETTRRIVITVLISIAVIGVIFFGTLRHVKHPFESDARDRELEYKPIENSIVGAFNSAVKLCFTRDMLLLSITFFYTGTLEWMALIHILSPTSAPAIINDSFAAIFNQNRNSICRF